jgi:hypothetical protein
MNNLKVKAFGGLLSVLVVMGALLFLSAWTLNYWQAWVLLVVFGAAWLVIIAYFMKKDPKLLERRMSAGPTAEQRTGQKVVMSIASLGFVALLVFPALDRRFGWSSVHHMYPLWEMPLSRSDGRSSFSSLKKTHIPQPPLK